MTYHSSKGLQFENVFLPNCTTSNPEDRPALYVAITRTYGTLYIMYSGSVSPLFDEIEEDCYDTTLQKNEEIDKLI